MISNDHPDFENPKDYNLDNVYEVEIEITDGNASHTITKLLKTIINGNEDPPEFTYDGAVVALWILIKPKQQNRHPTYHH